MSCARRTSKVSITGEGRFKTRVIVDGVDLSRGLTGINLTIGAGETPKLTLDVQLIDVTEIQDIDAQIYLSPASHDALVALGWTPPAENA
ncbi:hypothetical protein [Streptomyces sp.]|uniref:hypothetical protein n=1 Tax=Streptomyces sp. TaxID=1931 RepID=UPI002F3F938F